MKDDQNSLWDLQILTFKTMQKQKQSVYFLYEEIKQDEKSQWNC